MSRSRDRGRAGPYVDLPAPEAHAAAVSRRLASLIAGEIDDADGALAFERYMELSLYAPGLGYYSAGLRKFGSSGDFVTAPELTPLFGRCLARACHAVLQRLDGGEILEFGAGSGALAAELLSELERLGRLPGRYLILERSGDLRERQRELLARRVPDLAARVQWLDALPATGFNGIALGNEVLDAMPVRRFCWTGAGVEEFFVTCRDHRFAWLLRPAEDPRLVDYVESLAARYDLPPGYVSEVNLSLQPWVRSVSERVAAGLLLLIDYGYPRREYYHPQRDGGTLMCHYRHRVHDDPLILTGLQDITAHVDFTAVVEAGCAAGLQLEGFATQAHFLLDCGLEEIMAGMMTEAERANLELASQAKTLLMPGEMGERFKCVGLSRELEGPVPGFRGRDLRGRL